MEVGWQMGRCFVEILLECHEKKVLSREADTIYTMLHHCFKSNLSIGIDAVLIFIVYDLSIRTLSID